MLLVISPCTFVMLVIIEALTSLSKTTTETFRLVILVSIEALTSVWSSAVWLVVVYLPVSAVYCVLKLSLLNNPRPNVYKVLKYVSKSVVILNPTCNISAVEFPKLGDG